MKESRLAGIVSIGDVMKWRLDEPKHEGHALTLEEAMAEAARRVAPHSPNSQYRPARAAPLISDHPIASRSFSHGQVAAYLASNGQRGAGRSRRLQPSGHVLS